MRDIFRLLEKFPLIVNFTKKGKADTHLNKKISKTISKGQQRIKREYIPFQNKLYK